jgi:amino acid adenylation domain-containing protein
VSGTADFLERLRRLDIRVALEGDRLGVDAPKGALTPELREELARRKQEVVAFLGERRVEVPLEPVARGGPLPVSFTQELMWFFDRLQPGITAYTMHFGWCLRGSLDRVALEAALGDLTERHEVLRTTFGEDDGQVSQRIHAPRPVALSMGEIADPSDAAAMQYLHRESLRPFDLAQGPTMRAVLLSQAADRHWLLILYHHIAGDGWSSEIFARELAALYSARVSGRRAALAPLPVQYADYAHWQRRRLAEGKLAETLAYWKQQLAHAPSTLELPLDQPRTALPTYNGAVCMRTLDPALRDRLVAFSRAESATLFTTMLAAVNVVLARHSGQDELCVGVPVSGRERSELEPLIGVFINTVVMRTRIDPAMSFRDLLKAVREDFQGAMAHRDAPFEMVAKEAAPERSLNRSPLFQVMVNMLNFPVGNPVQFEGVDAQPVPVFAFGQVQSKFDLTLYLRDDPAGLFLAAVYNTDLFDARRIEEMVGQYEQLLARVVATPDAPVMHVPLVTPAATALLPDPSRPLQAAWTEPVHERFRRHAARAPTHAAIVSVEGTLSYGELEAASNRLANHLAAQGIGREDVVAVYAARNAGLAWAMLGAHKAGAAFMVLDPAQPAARSAQCLRLARPKAWLRIDGGGALPAALDAALAEIAPRVVTQWAPAARDSDWRQGAAEPPAREVGADDLAYVAFTSGSTGEPKAIAGTHRPLSHFFEWHVRTAALGPQDRFSVLSGLAHDPLLRDVLGPLWAGATAFMPEAARIGEPGYLGGWLAAQRITVCHLTPAMAELIAIGAAGKEPALLPALRCAFFGGDVLRADIVEALRRVAPAAACVNFYGATETPQAMGWYAIPRDPAQVPARIPLGRGIDDVQLLVLNAAGTLAGIGELGEIHVRTPYLARGYLGDAALTAGRFLPGPSGVPGDRMYRTGDLGRYGLDGTVEFAGRRDGQVKLRGFRVELGEIEAALREHPAVGEAVIDLTAHGAREARLVAYVVPRSGKAADANEMRDFLRARVPDYMVPAQFMALEALPLTPNGKVDRRRLPAPAPDAARVHVSPRTPTEVAIAAPAGAAGRGAAAARDLPGVDRRGPRPYSGGRARCGTGSTRHARRNNDLIHDAVRPSHPPAHARRHRDRGWRPAAPERPHRRRDTGAAQGARRQQGRADGAAARVPGHDGRRAWRARERAAFVRSAAHVDARPHGRRHRGVQHRGHAAPARRARRSRPRAGHGRDRAPPCGPADHLRHRGGRGRAGDPPGGAVHAAGARLHHARARRAVRAHRGPGRR